MATNEVTAMRDLYKKTFKYATPTAKIRDDPDKMRKRMINKHTKEARRKLDRAYVLVREYERRLIEEFKKTDQYLQLEQKIIETIETVTQYGTMYQKIEQRIAVMEAEKNARIQRYSVDAAYMTEDEFIQRCIDIQNTTRLIETDRIWLSIGKKLYSKIRKELYQLYYEQYKQLEECTRDPSKFKNKQFNPDRALLDTINDTTTI